MNRYRKKSSSVPGVLIGLAVIGGVVLVGGGLVLVVVISDPQRFSGGPRRRIETEQQRLSEIKQAFCNEPVIDDRELLEELQELFDQLGKDLVEHNLVRTKQHFDFVRMLNEDYLEANQPTLNSIERRQSLQNFATGYVSSLDRTASRWTKSDIRMIVRLPEEDERLVYVRHFNDKNGDTIPKRWWVRRSGLRWRVYDDEHLDTGIRNSTHNAWLITAETNGSRPRFDAAMDGLDRAYVALGARDYKKAEAELKALTNISLPAAEDSLRWDYHGNLAFRLGQYQKALRCYDRVERLNPRFLTVHVARADVFSRLGKHAEALRHLQKHAALLGDEAGTAFDRGKALARLGRNKEAAVELKLAFKLDPKSILAVDELRRVLPDAKKQMLVEFLTGGNLQKNEFDRLANFAAGDQDGPGLQSLAEALIKNYPNDPAAKYHLARAHLLNSQYDLAIPLFAKAIRGQGDASKRRRYLEDFLWGMNEAGRALDGYNSAPDKKEAFTIAAEDLLRDFRFPVLQQLIEAHRKRYPNDSWTHFFDAESAIDEGDYQRASGFFAKIDGKHLDTNQQKKLLTRRIFARFQSGDSLAAYGELTPKKDVFLELARLCVRNKKTGDLKPLIDLHRKHSPNDENLAVYEAEYHWNRKDHASVAAVLSKNRDVMKIQAHRYRLEPWFFASLYALKRNEQAAREAAGLFSGTAQNNRIRLEDVYYRLRDDKMPDSTLRFANACINAHPEDPEAIFLLARAQALNGKFSQAGANFQKAWQRSDDLRKTGMQSSILFDCADDGKALEAYRIALNPQRGFATLAADLLRKKNHQLLRELIAAHRKKQPDDPTIELYDGKLAMEEKKYRQAELILLNGMEKAADTIKKGEFRREWIKASFYVNGAAKTYERAGPGIATFNGMNWLCNKPEHAKQLQALVDSHRKHFPNDKMLPYWEVEAHWLAQDYSKVVETLRRNRQRILAVRYQRWKYNDRLVRSLLRLKKFDEAKAGLNANKKYGINNLILEAAVYAASGDVETTARILKRCKNRYFDNRTLYTDADLGKALRSDRFRELREKYPEPKDKLK